MSLPAGPRQPAAFMIWRWMRRPFEFLDDCARRFGDTFTMRFPGFPPLVVFSDPEAVKGVFTDTTGSMDAGKFNQSLRAFLGDESVLMLDKKEHLRHRRLLLPPFHGERMHAYGQAMLDITDQAIDAWPVGTPFAVHPHMQRVTLEVILRTVFGFSEGPRLRRMSEITTKILELGSWPPLLLPFMQKDLGRFSPWGRFKRTVAQGDAILFAEIRDRRASDVPLGDDILSLLLAARDEHGQPMSDSELRDELTTLLVAGHETTATALAWALRWILGSPLIARRLKDEIDGAARSGELTPERISKLELLDAVVRETLRLQPVVPIVGRILDKPTRVGGHDLPAGTGVLCAIYLAQRRPAAYPDPTRFDPDRFLGKKFTPYEFFPFGGGVRRCIGMAFALYEIKMVLARVLARTSLRLEPDVPIKVVRRSITLTPSGGLRVILDARSPRARPPPAHAAVPAAPGAAATHG